MIVHAFRAELRELEQAFPFDWNYISPKAQRAITYLQPFQGYTTSEGRLIATAYTPFSGDLISEIFVIHGIKAYLSFTSQYLQDPYFPIIYKCIGINYAFVLLVRLHSAVFEVIFLIFIHFQA